MNTSASAMVELLVLLVVAVLSSGVVLLLVHTGVLEVRSNDAEYAQEKILNTEFITLAKESAISIQAFQFCASVDEKYRCQDAKESFFIGERIYFRFVVESSSTDGKVLLVENYQVKDASGKVVLEVDQRNNLYVQKENIDTLAYVPFKDFLISEYGDASGVYTLELMIENPALDKKTTLKKEFMLVER